MTKRICLVVFLLFTGFAVGGIQSATAQNRAQDADVAASSSIAPPFITPGKELFVTREGDAFVVAVTATCLLEDDSEGQFELLPSSPGFVRISTAYRKENIANGYTEGLGLVYVTPQMGDAGKYVVSLQVKACSGKVERLITFRIHVKQGHLD